MLATVGTDSVCKIWDIKNQNMGKVEPKMVTKKELKQGELFSVQFYEDIPWVLAAGGSKGEVAVWDTEESDVVADHFRITLDPSAPKEPKAIVVEDDGNEDFEDISDGEQEKKKKKKSKKN